MKPSKTIKKKAYETIYSEEHDIPSDIFLPEEAFLAICDYLDEEYEKQQKIINGDYKINPTEIIPAKIKS